MEENDSGYFKTSETDETIRWVKPGKVDRIAFVNDDVLAIVCTNFILFYNLTSNEESIYQADCDHNGNGIRFVAGYGYAYIFAFSDKSVECKIKVCNYPQFEVITSLGEKRRDDFYVALAFNPSEYLISLTGLPTHEIALWNWRTGQKLTSRESGLNFNFQTIKFSPHSASVFFQFGQNENSHKLRLWEAVSCVGTHKLLPSDVTFIDKHRREITCCCWSPDGHIFGVDATGTIHVIAKDELTWKKLAICKHSSDQLVGRYQLLWFKGGLLKELKDKAVQHYKRLSLTEWQVSWRLNVPIDTKILLINRSRDCIIGYGYKGELIRIDGKSSCKLIKSYMFNFEKATFLYPLENKLATISENYLSVWLVDSGELVGTVQFEAKCIQLICLTENAPLESCCIFCVMLQTGVMALLMLDEETCKPIVISYVFLCNEVISEVSSINTDEGLLVIPSFISGKLFSLSIESEVEHDSNAILVSNYFDTGKNIKKAKLAKYTEEPLLIVLMKSESIFDSEFAVFNKELKMVASICMQNCQVVDFVPGYENYFYMALQGSIMIHIVHFEYDECRATIVSQVGTGHQLRGFHFSCFRNDFLSFGWDGIVMIIDLSSGDLLKTFSALHRFENGINYAVSDGYRRHVLVISDDNSLVCYKLFRESGSEYEAKEKCDASLPNNTIAELAVPKYVYPHDGNLERTWLILYMEELSLKEKEACEADISYITSHLADLKSEIQSMLDDNFIVAEEKQLDIEEFELDWETRDKRVAKASAEQEQMKRSFIDQIDEYNGMASKIIRNCWDSMNVKTRRIKAFNNSFSVENYGQLPKNAEFEAELKRVQTLQKLQAKYRFGDRFYPWLEKSNLSKPKCRRMTSSERIDVVSSIIGSEKEKDFRKSELLIVKMNDIIEIGRRFELSGASSWKFVDIPEQLITQMTFTSHIDTCLNFIMFELVLTKLQDFFNKKFDEAFDEKENEVDRVIRWNDRLREIIYEMEHACRNPSTEEPPVDPQFRPMEKPSKIITVEDSEVPVDPYISPSELQLRIERAAEEERLRLLQIADNFRELALIEMMDGVLEIRWEDELKKDVELPKCMTTKEPENFDENDLRSIMEYEKECAFLNSERDRYRKMLVQEYHKIKESIADSTERFDNFLLSILQLKTSVDAAINHEMFKMTRFKLNCYKFSEFDEKEVELAKHVRNVEREAGEQLRQLEALKENEAGARATLDQAVSRDRQMDRRFKSELINYNLTPIVLDYLTKQFRRRPKIVQASGASPQLLYDVAKCVRNPEFVDKIYLPSEYHDFLKSLENYESFSNAPTNLDENVWKVFIQVRRNKIENEFKVKASTLEVADAERMVSKAVSAMQLVNEEAALSKLKSLREERTRFNHNFQVQLVLKQGQLELQTSGQISDFEDCVLIDRSLVENINNLVKQAGAEKLRVMYEAANFHRGIIFKEWEHKMLRMRIEDLKHELQQIVGVRVTRLVKTYLKRVARFGEPTLEELITVNKDIPALKKIQVCHDRAVKELNAKLAEVQKEHQEMEKESEELDRCISSLNDEVTELHIQRDLEFESNEEPDTLRRMNVINRRGRLTDKIQDMNKEIATLQTELEILRMRTYPTLRHRSLI